MYIEYYQLTHDPHPMLLMPPGGHWFCKSKKHLPKSISVFVRNLPLANILTLLAGDIK